VKPYTSTPELTISKPESISFSKYIDIRRFFAAYNRDDVLNTLISTNKKEKNVAYLVDNLLFGLDEYYLFIQVKKSEKYQKILLDLFVLYQSKNITICIKDEYIKFHRFFYNSNFTLFSVDSIASILSLDSKHIENEPVKLGFYFPCNIENGYTRFPHTKDHYIYKVVNSLLETIDKYGEDLIFKKLIVFIENFSYTVNEFHNFYTKYHKDKTFYKIQIEDLSIIAINPNNLIEILECDNLYKSYQALVISGYDMNQIKKNFNRIIEKVNSNKIKNTSDTLYEIDDAPCKTDENIGGANIWERFCDRYDEYYEKFLFVNCSMDILVRLLLKAWVPVPKKISSLHDVKYDNLIFDSMLQNIAFFEVIKIIQSYSKQELIELDQKVSEFWHVRINDNFFEFNDNCSIKEIVGERINSILTMYYLENSSMTDIENYTGKKNDEIVTIIYNANKTILDFYSKELKEFITFLKNRFFKNVNIIHMDDIKTAVHISNELILYIFYSNASLHNSNIKNIQNVLLWKFSYTNFVNQLLAITSSKKVFSIKQLLIILKNLATENAIRQVLNNEKGYFEHYYDSLYRLRRKQLTYKEITLLCKLVDHTMTKYNSIKVQDVYNEILKDNYNLESLSFFTLEFFRNFIRKQTEHNVVGENIIKKIRVERKINKPQKVDTTRKDSNAGMDMQKRTLSIPYEENIERGIVQILKASPLAKTSIIQELKKNGYPSDSHSVISILNKSTRIVKINKIKYDLVSKYYSEENKEILDWSCKILVLSGFTDIYVILSKLLNNDLFCNFNINLLLNYFTKNEIFTLKKNEIELKNKDIPLEKFLNGDNSNYYSTNQKKMIIDLLKIYDIRNQANNQVPETEDIITSIMEGVGLL